LTRAKGRLLRFFAATLALCAASLAVAADGAPIPNFWDPQHRIDRPETSSIRVIRFVTEDDYPPFGFVLPDGALSGFNVDLARALCEELRVQCTVQARRWDTIFETIEQSRADAAVASIAMTPANRARVDFTAPYYKTPARFVARAPGRLAGTRCATETFRQVDPDVDVSWSVDEGAALAALAQAHHFDLVDLAKRGGVMHLGQINLRWRDAGARVGTPRRLL
jgi:ABC-type amino acid transport substrate-binding protein